MRAICLLFVAGCQGSLSGGGSDAGSTDEQDAFVARVDSGSAADDAGPEPDPDGGPIGIDAGPPDTRPSSARHTQRRLGDTDAPQGFWEYLPPRYGDGNDHPLLVFLHGVGENGNGMDQLGSVAANGPPRIIENDAWPNERPFIVLSPQHPGGGCPSASEVHAFFEWAMSAYDVDLDRVYLTGLSCGAIGSFGYLGAHLDEQIVAMVPIAGDGNGEWNARGCELGRVAIWAFHGDDDRVVLPTGTTTPMEQLIECGDRMDARMTIYPGVGHDSWSRTYDLSEGHDIYTWLLSFSR